jgi:hypothetical protein
MKSNDTSAIFLHMGKKIPGKMHAKLIPLEKCHRKNIKWYRKNIPILRSGVNMHVKNLQGCWKKILYITYGKISPGKYPRKSI